MQRFQHEGSEWKACFLCTASSQEKEEAAGRAARSQVLAPASPTLEGRAAENAERPRVLHKWAPSVREETSGWGGVTLPHSSRGHNLKAQTRREIILGSDWSQGQVILAEVNLACPLCPSFLPSSACWICPQVGPSWSERLQKLR